MMINITLRNIIRHNHVIAIISTLLFLIPAKLAYADDLAGMAVVVFFVVHFAIIISAVSSVFVKYAFYNFVYSKDSRISWGSYFLVMIVEIVIITVFTYSFMYATTSWLLGRGFDMWITSFLSYISIDVAMIYFRNIFVEHRLFWSLVSKSIPFGLILPFIIYFPNYILLRKHIKKLNNRYKLWFHSYLFSILSPVLFCLAIILIMAFSQPDHTQFSPQSKENPDIKTIMLREASSAGNIRLVEVSIGEGAVVNAEIANDHATVLHYMLQQSGNADTLRLLLKKGANVNSKKSDGYTPLMIACSKVPADNEIVQLLIENGADVNAQTSYGVTALKVAARRNQGIWVERYGVKDTMTEKILLDHGANPNIADTDGSTALTEAVKANNDELVKLLLDRGAVPPIK